MLNMTVDVIQRCTDIQTTALAGTTIYSHLTTPQPQMVHLTISMDIQVKQVCHTESDLQLSL